MWTSICFGHCFHGPSILRTVQNVSTAVDSSPLWTLFARPSSVHIRGPSLYFGCKSLTNMNTMPLIFAACSKMIDLAIVMDSSGSIGYENFERQKTFARALIGHLDMETEVSHVSLVTFGDEPHTEFDLNDYAINPSDTARAIYQCPYIQGATHTFLALDHVR